MKLETITDEFGTRNAWVSDGLPWSRELSKDGKYIHPEFLREFLKKAGIGIREAARRCGRNPRTIRAIINGAFGRSNELAMSDFLKMQITDDERKIAAGIYVDLF